LNIYSLSLHSVNICIISYNVLIYKILFVTYNKLLKGTYINYNAIEFLRHIAFNSNIYKGVLFLVYKVYNRFNKYTYKWVFKCN
jgi:hypothetical protein